MIKNFLTIIKYYPFEIILFINFTHFEIPINQFKYFRAVNTKLKIPNNVFWYIFVLFKS